MDNRNFIESKRYENCREIALGGSRGNLAGPDPIPNVALKFGVSRTPPGTGRCVRRESTRIGNAARPNWPSRLAWDQLQLILFALGAIAYELAGSR